MKKYIILPFVCLLFAALPTFAQGPQLDATTTSQSKSTVDPMRFAETISSRDLKDHLRILASDEFEGRETGTVGNDKAAKYISDQFQRLGLPAIGDDDSYFQKVGFTWTMWNEVAMSVNNQSYRHLWDYYSYPVRNAHLPNLETEEVIFLGYGIDDPAYSDYKRARVKGKVIMIYKDEPTDAEGRSYITGSEELSEWSTNWEKKLVVAHQKGVKAVLIIESEIQKSLADNRRFLLGPLISMGNIPNPADNYANSAYISTKIAKEIMGDRLKKVVKARDRIRKKGKSRRVKLKVKLKITQNKNERKLEGQNVLGYVEGIDPLLKEELVVVSAHYDHLGKKGDQIYNGADDNGSGTSTVLELAEAFSQAKAEGSGPRRSVLFMLVTGEEKGLLGSKYYTERPLFPLENTIANVNVDMVGRVDDKHLSNPNYIYVIGSDRLSTELHEINESANKQYTQLELDYTYNDRNDPNRYYYRSDHYNFAEKGIPAIFYFNGTHADYHRTSDTIEKINFRKMTKVAKLVFHTTWELANRDKRIIVDVEE
ncbi:MAG: M28 family peptidase [Bacteroidota bacterium]